MEVSRMVIFFGTILCFLQIVTSEPSVNIHQDSRIIGQTVTLSGVQVNQYLGIPYAKAPIGRLRFKNPVAFLKYPPVLRAVAQPPACHQYTTQPFPWYVNSTDKSEDCLYLNIWTPSNANTTNKKAVLYWIHGGGFRYGSIISDVFSGIPFASLGDIIVVTVNYRLGPFGFLSSGTRDAPGNAGSWDMLEGLRWINRNIEAFGGDTSRITLAGESVGAFSVGYLSVSPLAEGLYARQIMKSGSPTSHFVDDNFKNLKLSQKLAKFVGCATDEYTIMDHPRNVVQCLKDVDPVTISKADYPLAPHSSLDFVPQWGDELLPSNPRTAIVNGDFRCTDLLIGSNKDEGSLFLTTAYPKVYGFFGEKNTLINKTSGRYTLRELISAYGVPDEESVVNYYLPDNLPEDSYHEVRHQVYTSIGDLTFICPGEYYAEKCAEKGKNVHSYFWTHRPSITPWAPWMGVAHFSEVQFVFGQPLLNPGKYHASEVELSSQIIEIWSSFIKYGKPSIPWPLYSKESPAYKILGPEFVTGENGSGRPHPENCDFLRSRFGF